MIQPSREHVAAIPWQVPRLWDGATCAVLASGPSMSQAVADAVKGRCKVIAVNNQGIDTVVDDVLHPALAPWADILYAADRRWWIENQKNARTFAGIKVTIEPVGGSERLHFDDVFILKNAGKDVLFDPRPTHLGGGGNSGFHAVHLAAHLGATKILLCGFDMKAGPTGQHWFGEHPWCRDLKMCFDIFIDRFERSANAFRKQGVQIINCTPDSALKCFPFMTIEEALAC